jgi:hypothetical protein
MSLKLSAFLVVMLAIICLGQQSLAQKTTPVSTHPVFVPMPDDIQCWMEGVQSQFSFGANGETEGTVVSVREVICQIAGQSPPGKEIPLASTEVTHGMLSTKDFGGWKLTRGKDPSSGIKIAIRRDKLQSFRAFLQK